MTKNTIQNSFVQILAIYTLAVILIVLGVLYKYSVSFSIAGIIIAILGTVIIKKYTYKSMHNILHYTFLALAILLLLVTRITPYINNSVPLGYDPGIYKYAAERGLENKDFWVRDSVEPGFLYLMEFFKIFLNTNQILIGLLIAFTLLLGIVIYLTTKEYYDKDTALIAIYLYAFSLIQFSAYWYMYYKNIIGLSLMLLAFLFLKKEQRIPLIISGILLGAIHRPTFYIFGLTYAFYTMVKAFKDKKIFLDNVLNGIIMAVGAFLFYVPDFLPAITQLIAPVATSFIDPGQASGTFMNFFTYQYSILPYIIFAILGLIALIKLKEFNILFYYAIITSSSVIFQFFFFNRFIIHLDIAAIILAAIGFIQLINHNKKFGVIITVLLLLCAGVMVFKESINAKPLVDEQELSNIEYINTLEPDAYVLSTSSYYSPWLLGYSGRKVIAPGLFDYDTHTKDEWIVFWETEDIEEIKNFMKDYPKPLYVYSGIHQKNTVSKFPECFEQIKEGIYKYIC